MIENLISEGIGVVVELALVYFLIDFLLKKREKKRMKPVREMILTSIYSASGILIDCASNLIVAPSKESPSRVAAARSYLQVLPAKIGELNKLVDLGGHALEAKMLAHVLKIIEQLEKSHHKLVFFAQIYSSDRRGNDIVGIPPFEGMELISGEITEFIDSIGSEDVREVMTVDTIRELRNSWLNAEKSIPNLFLDISTFHGNKNREPLVYSDRELVQMALSNVNKVSVFQNVH